MATITQTRTLSRIQIINIVGVDDPTVERWMDVQNLADGAAVGPTVFTKLKDRPKSSFATVADFFTVADSDVIA